MRAWMRRPQRGQALVLMALTMLLVTMMVLVTLGMSMRVKEKMEVQQVADAAAYSSAVATSRVMNSMALLNRVHISNMVALSANQSLISWSGLYFGVVNQFNDAIQGKSCRRVSRYCRRVVCPQWSQIQAASRAEQARVAGLWDGLDQAAALQSNTWQKGVMEEQEELKNALIGYVFGEGGRTLTREIIDAATEGDPHAEWTPAISSSVFKGDDRGGETAFRRTTSREAGTEATHGSRGDTFVTSRADGGLGSHIKGAFGAATVSGTDSVDGEGWFGDEDASGATGYGTEYGFNPRSANARDQVSARITFMRPPCVELNTSASAPAWVFSDDRTISTNDEHQFHGSMGADSESATRRHTMGDCNSCPGIWVSFLDLDLDKVVNGDEHLFGQPKAIVAVKRDYSRRDENGDPWALRFTVDGNKSFDNRGVETTDGARINVQLAAATALSYYHRPGDDGRRWVEPPTLFNPFWRATLVSPAIDSDARPNTSRPGRLQLTLDRLGAEGTQGREVVDGLLSQGFKGWQ